MTEATGATGQEATSTSAAPDVPEEPEERGLVDRLRGYVPWIAVAVLLVALLGSLKWWGDQQQHATRRGRAWPPEPVKVFFGR